MTEARARKIPATAAGEKAAAPYRVKLVDPDARHTWQHPQDETFSVIIRPVAIPTMSTDIFVLGQRYIDAGVVEVLNPEPVRKPSGGWTSILPGDVQTALFIEIQTLSNLTEGERRD